MRAAGQFAAAHVTLVNNVVVQKGRRMHELDRGSELHMAFAGDSRPEARSCQREHGPKPLAARRDQVVRHFRESW
jgi:hypothetical protein